MFYVYILENKDRDLYFSCTQDLKKRLKEHNQGRTFSTRGGAWKVIYYEACTEEKDARRREKYMKTSQGRRMLRLRLKEYFYKRRAS